MDPRRLRRSLRIAVLLTASLTVGGCLADLAVAVGKEVITEVLKPGPTRLEATVTAAADVNPDIEGKASPIQVRLFELGGDGPFNKAGFFALYDNDEKVLGKDLLNREEVVLKPGQSMTIERELNEQAKFLAVLAAFQDLDNATWRTIVPLTPHETNELSVEIGHLSVTIQEKSD